MCALHTTNRINADKIARREKEITPASSSWRVKEITFAKTDVYKKGETDG